MMKAFKKLFSQKERLAIKEKTRYFIVDPDQNSDDETFTKDADASIKRNLTMDQKQAELSSGHFSEQSFDQS